MTPHYSSDPSTPTPVSKKLPLIDKAPRHHQPKSNRRSDAARSSPSPPPSWIDRRWRSHVLRGFGRLPQPPRRSVSWRSLAGRLGCRRRRLLDRGGPPPSHRASTPEPSPSSETERTPRPSNTPPSPPSAVKTVPRYRR